MSLVGTPRTGPKKRGSAIRLLRKQDAELVFAKERLTLAGEEQDARDVVEEEILQAHGSLLALHFPSNCRKCEAPMEYYLTSPFPKWTCDFCGHGYTTATYTCSQTPIECSNTYCTKCFRNRHKVAPRTPDPPTPPPPKPKKAPKKPKPKPVTELPLDVARRLDVDEASCRQRLEAAMRDGLDGMLRLHATVLSMSQQMHRKHEEILKSHKHEVSAADARRTVDTAEAGWNVSKADEQTASYSAVQSREEMVAFAEKIQQWYREKPGDVVTELIDNLRFPDTVDTLSVLSAISNALVEKDEVVALYGGVLAELLSLRQYTQKPIDIDRDVMWGDIPDDKAQHSDYEQRHSDWNWENEDKRNGSIFGPVCSALRDQGPGGTQSGWSEAVLKKWIKWLCTVGAVCSQPCQEVATVWRGLGGGCLPGFVVENHRHLQGSVMGWPALSSTSFDRDASYSYMMGLAANSTSRPNREKPGTILFRISAVRAGQELQALSQYPEEAELLLGPFNMLRIDSVEPDTRNPFKNEKGQPMGLFVNCTALGPVDAPEFHRDVRTDAVKASKRLQTHGNEEKLSALKMLAEALQAPLQGSDSELLSKCHSVESFVEALRGVVAESPAVRAPPVKGEAECCKELGRHVAAAGVPVPQGGFRSMAEAGRSVKGTVASLKANLDQAQQAILASCEERQKKVPTPAPSEPEVVERAVPLLFPYGNPCNAPRMRALLFS